ncbi:MAG: hypothetical protein K2N47_01075, partial [Clostridia bacterium]|nr:hypothetical protein [Clostridia bacterium]
YKLYLSIQPFFMTLWIGFVVLVIIIAVSFNDMFVMTLINIMIPSLSAITMIGNSWYNCKLQMKELMVLINVIDQIEAMPTSRKLEYTKDPENIRILADGLFKYRSSAFVIPNFLVRRHNKIMAKNKETIHGSETPRFVIAAHRSEAAATTAKSQTVAAKPAAIEKASPSSQKTVIATSKPTASKTVAPAAKTPQKAVAPANKAATPTKAVSPKTSAKTANSAAKAKANTSSKSTKK